MDMNHLIGQRFNLISKSDIRYVGTLHEINPEASTIALENVVSFGTEGRRGNAAEEIGPSASVYEYIVFRGSDVKDISVAEEKKENEQPAAPPQVPDDPAILGSMSRPGPPQAPPQSQPPQQQAQSAHQSPAGYPQHHQHQFPGYFPPYNQRFGPPAFPPGPGFPNMPYGAPPGWFPPPGQGFPPGPGHGHFPHHQMPIGPPGQPPPVSPGQPQQPQRRGVSGPPAGNVAKPTSELPVGDKAGNKPTSRNITPAPAPTAQKPPVPPVESKPTVAEAMHPSAATAQKVSAPAAAIPSAVAGASSKVAPAAGPRGDRVIPAIPVSTPMRQPSSTAPAVAVGGPGNNLSQGTAQAAITEATRAATAAVAAAMAKLPQPSAPKKGPDANVDALTKKMNEMKPLDGSRGQRGGQQYPRGGRGGHRQHHPAAPAKKVEVPDTDYDFETANAKFNKQDLVKEAIASGSPVGEAEGHPVNGTPEATGETPNGAAAAQPSTAAAYNKASSFFDNISSEARDREEGTAGRPGGREWRGEEERRNLETFGQGSVDGYRGGYRGRGRGRGYGGGRGRGGYGRGHSRGRGGLRGGRGASQSTGVPTLT